MARQPEEKYKTRVELEFKFEQRDEYEYDFTFARGRAGVRVSPSSLEWTYQGLQGPACSLTASSYGWRDSAACRGLELYRGLFSPVDQAVCQG